MAKKVFVRLQTPTVEIEVSAVDAGGTKDSMVVGFLRKETKEAEKILKDYQGVLEAIQKLPATALENDRFTLENKLDSFLKDNILYFKGATVLKEIELEDGTTSLVEETIADTRQATDDETLWGPAKEAVPFLLQMFLGSSPWRVSLTAAFFRAMYNINLDEASKGN